MSTTDQNLNFALAVVLWHPSEEEIGYIYRYLNCFEHVYVIDNSNCNLPKELLEDARLTYINKGENLGLAKAYNLVLKDPRLNEYDLDHISGTEKK